MDRKWVQEKRKRRLEGVVLEHVTDEGEMGGRVI